MDTLTHALLGGVAAQAAFAGPLGRKAWLVGAAGAVLPDLDPLLKPLADPAFPIEYHRHLTHSLVFAPCGAALAAIPFLATRWGRGAWRAVGAAALLGLLTHLPLDLATSYGTLLFWPFSDARPAWDVIAVVDPIFTVVLLAGLLLAVLRPSRRAGIVALVLAGAYLGLGGIQHARAAEAHARVARARGHVPEHARVMPTLANLLVWRSVYVAEGWIYADELRVLPDGAVHIREGGRVRQVTAADLPAEVPDPDRLGRVFERFRHFADGFTAWVPDTPHVVGDMRYSMGSGFLPIWGLRVRPGEDPSWARMFGARKDLLARLAAAVFDGEAFVPLEAALHPPATREP